MGTFYILAKEHITKAYRQLAEMWKVFLLLVVAVAFLNTVECHYGGDYDWGNGWGGGYEGWGYGGWGYGGYGGWGGWGYGPYRPWGPFGGAKVGNPGSPPGGYGFARYNNPI